MPATTNDSSTAGPAWSAAALPVRTKMPAPMMQPTPSSSRFHLPSVRFSSLVAVSRWTCAIDLRANMRSSTPRRGGMVAINVSPWSPTRTSSRLLSGAKPRPQIVALATHYRPSSRQHRPERPARRRCGRGGAALPARRARRCWRAGDSRARPAPRRARPCRPRGRSRRSPRPSARALKSSHDT